MISFIPWNLKVKSPRSRMTNHQFIRHNNSMWLNTRWPIFILCNWTQLLADKQTRSPPFGTSITMFQVTETEGIEDAYQNLFSVEGKQRVTGWWSFGFAVGVMEVQKGWLWKANSLCYSPHLRFMALRCLTMNCNVKNPQNQNKDKRKTH